jgi:phosphatidylglycerophosphate synthase
MTAPSVTAAPHATARSIWTRLTVDPIVMPLAPRVGRWSFVTPNRITAFAGLLAVASVACFALGQLRLAGLLFILRYMADCLDGQVARVQRRGSTVGAAFDITVDVVGISAVYAAIAWYLVTEGRLALVEALVLLALVVVYNWALAYRKALAKTAGSGDDGGAGGMLPTEVPGLRRWSRFCLRIGMSPLPWAVEAEIVALGVGPLVLPEPWVPVGLHCAVAFYVLANVVNLRRIFRIARAIDSGSFR